MMSCDYWLNSDNLAVINEFWQFVKAIYQQSPIAFNRVFPVQNLIDLMVKISENKDTTCCAFHRESFDLFYQGGVQDPAKLKPSLTGQWVMVERASSLEHADENPFSAPKPEMAVKTSAHDIDKYLSPIAGVLEGVLTCGGNEILDQI